MGFFAYMWVGLLILFLVLEGSTVALVSLWFAVGSLAAIVAALLKDGRAHVTGLYSEKSGKTYDATVVLEDTGQYVNFKLDFDRQKGGGK